MAKKSLQAMDDEDLEDSMSEDEVAAGSGEGGSESEEEQEWEPWLAPVVKDEAVTPARVTFYSQGDGKEMQDGWERVKAVEIPNPFDVVHNKDKPSEQRSIRVTRNSKLLLAVSPGCAPYIALVRRIWKCPPGKEEALPKAIKGSDPCVFNIKDFKMEVLWFYRINEAVGPNFLPRERRIAKSLLSGAKFGRAKEEGSERQLLFSSHSSLHDDDEAEHTNMEDKGLPLECVLSECTVYFLREEEEQPRQAFLTPTGDYVERRAPGFVARYFLHYVIPYRCLALGDTWEDPHHHTHDLARKFLRDTRAQLEKLEEANAAVRQEFRSLFPDKAAELEAKGWAMGAQQQQALQYMFASPKKPQKPPKQKTQQPQQQQKPAGGSSSKPPPKPPQQQQGHAKQAAAAPVPRPAAAAAVPKPLQHPPSPKLCGMDEEEGSEQLLVHPSPAAVLITPPRPLGAPPTPAGSGGRGRSASLQLLSRDEVPAPGQHVPSPPQQRQHVPVLQAGGQLIPQQQQQQQVGPRAGGTSVAEQDSSQEDVPIAQRKPAGAGAAAGGVAAAAAATHHHHQQQQQQQAAPPARAGGATWMAEEDSSEDDAPLIARYRSRPAGAAAAVAAAAAAAAGTNLQQHQQQQQPKPTKLRDLAGLLEDSDE